MFGDDEWIPSFTDAEAFTADIPEGQPTDADPNGTAHDQGVDSQKVRPIQMVEFVRKYVSRRLLALIEGEIAALMTVMRQVGVGSHGGVEALAIFHQLIFDDWVSGSLNTSLGRVNFYEKTASE